MSNLRRLQFGWFFKEVNSIGHTKIIRYFWPSLYIYLTFAYDYSQCRHRDPLDPEAARVEDLKVRLGQGAAAAAAAAVVLVSRDDDVADVGGRVGAHLGVVALSAILWYSLA